MVTITFAAGVMQAEFTVTTLNDSVSELLETFEASLSNSSVGLQVGHNSTATITIEDDDSEQITTSIILQCFLGVSVHT